MAIVSRGAKSTFFVHINKNSVTDHVLIVAVETDTGTLAATSWGVLKHNSEWQKSTCLALPLPPLIRQMDGTFGRRGWASLAAGDRDDSSSSVEGYQGALAQSTYCVLLTEPWCHHRPLALTACHHVALELMVKPWKVRTVSKDGTFRLNIVFSNASQRISSCLVHSTFTLKLDWAYIWAVQIMLQIFAIFPCCLNASLACGIYSSIDGLKSLHSWCWRCFSWCCNLIRTQCMTQVKTSDSNTAL